jgi:hypothetical protein
VSGSERLCPEHVSASNDELWRRLGRDYNAGRPIVGIFTGVVADGLRVDLYGTGEPAFVPELQIDLLPVDPAVWVGRRGAFEIVSYDRMSGCVVLSRRSVMFRERQKYRVGLRSHLKVGMIVDGVVTSVADYGAMVDVGGDLGLLHRVDVSDPPPALSDPTHGGLVAGQRLRTVVLQYDPTTHRIALSLKSLRVGATMSPLPFVVPLAEHSNWRLASLLAEVSGFENQDAMRAMLGELLRRGKKPEEVDEMIKTCRWAAGVLNPVQVMPNARRYHLVRETDDLDLAADVGREQKLYPDRQLIDWRALIDRHRDC